MKLIGVNGSHRRNSNAGMMLSTALDACVRNDFEVEQIDLAEADIRFCTDCNGCRDKFTCTQDDDVMDMLEKLAKADGIIIASPTYFAGITGRLRSLFDRSIPLRRNGMMLAGKVGAALVVGGSRNGGQEHVVEQIHQWMLIHQMTVVGDRETAHFGGICVGRAPGDALKDEVGMRTVLNTAENVCDTLEKAK